MKRELVACLRIEHASRVPRARTQGRGKNFITPEVMISERAAEVVDRSVPRHREGDVVIEVNSSGIATLPKQLRRSLTWNQGVEMARHTQRRERGRLTEDDLKSDTTEQGWRWHANGEMRPRSPYCTTTVGPTRRGRAVPHCPSPIFPSPISGLRSADAGRGTRGADPRLRHRGPNFPPLGGCPRVTPDPC